MNQSSAEKSNFSTIITAILVFVLIVIIAPFFESKLIIMWQVQDNGQKYNVFNSFTSRYAGLAEQVKREIGWSLFFEEENKLWMGIKGSPVLFNQNSAEEKNILIDSATTAIFIKEMKKQVIFSQAYNFWLSVQEENKRLKKEQTQQFLSFLNDSIREEIGVDISLFVKPEAVARDDTQEREKPIGNNSIETKQDNLATPKLDNSFNLSYLIVGDSFMAVGGGLGDVVEKTVLNYGNTTVNRYGMVSSGLSRPDYFDWNSQAEKLVSKYKPDIVIAMFGANDNQNLTDKSGNFVAKYGEQSWVDEYSNRVSDMLSIFEENKIIVFWVGLPVMREKWFSEKVAKLDSIYDDECQKRQNAYFVSTWRTLADSDGKYSAYLKNGQGRNELARIRDGIHLTYFGGALVTQEISKKISEVLDKKLSLLSFK